MSAALIPRKKSVDHEEDFSWLDKSKNLYFMPIVPDGEKRIRNSREGRAVAIYGPKFAEEIDETCMKALATSPSLLPLSLPALRDTGVPARSISQRPVIASSRKMDALTLYVSLLGFIRDRFDLYLSHEEGDERDEHGLWRTRGDKTRISDIWRMAKIRFNEVNMILERINNSKTIGLEAYSRPTILEEALAEAPELVLGDIVGQIHKKQFNVRSEKTRKLCQRASSYLISQGKYEYADQFYLQLTEAIRSPMDRLLENCLVRLGHVAYTMSFFPEFRESCEANVRDYFQIKNLRHMKEMLDLP